MAHLDDPRAAKQYLAGRIVAEAEREGLSLSDVERKMLYFTENCWTLPDMTEVSAAFDREYDRREYEGKIAGLVRNLKDRMGQEGSDRARWEEAVCTLSDEDHYILVLIGGAGASSAPAGRPAGDVLRLIMTALAIVAALLTTLILVHR